jgi:hypothetical protein
MKKGPYITRFDKLEEKIDKIDDKLLTMSTWIQRNAVSLEEHMRRTDLLEKKLEPVEDHVAKVTAGLKILTWAVGIVLAIAGLWISFAK